MTVRLYVPRDAAALALGADRVAKKLAEEAAGRVVARSDGGESIADIEKVVPVRELDAAIDSELQ